MLGAPIPSCGAGTLGGAGGPGSGNHPLQRNVRRRVYISLQQTHLPKPDGLDIVDYDDTTTEVQPGEHASAVGVYLEVVPKYGLSFAEFHAGLGVLGALLVAATEAGVPVLGAVPASGWVLVVFVVLVAPTLTQTYAQRSSIITACGRKTRHPNRPHTGDGGHCHGVSAVVSPGSLRGLGASRTTR